MSKWKFLWQGFQQFTAWMAIFLGVNLILFSILAITQFDVPPTICAVGLFTGLGTLVGATNFKAGLEEPGAKGEDGD